jgi:hypothetical protein
MPDTPATSRPLDTEAEKAAGEVAVCRLSLRRKVTRIRITFFGGSSFLTKAFDELKALGQDGLWCAEEMMFRGLVEMENHTCRAHFVDHLTELRDTIDDRLAKLQAH